MKQKTKLLVKDKSFNERRVCNSILGRIIILSLLLKSKSKEGLKKEE